EGSSCEAEPESRARGVLLYVERPAEGSNEADGPLPLGQAGTVAPLCVGSVSIPFNTEPLSAMRMGRLGPRDDPQVRRPARRPLLPTLSRKEDRSMWWLISAMVLGLWTVPSLAQELIVQQQPQQQEAQQQEGTPDVATVPTKEQPRRIDPIV